jgi:hypothetical protein
MSKRARCLASISSLLLIGCDSGILSFEPVDAGSSSDGSSSGGSSGGSSSGGSSSSGSSSSSGGSAGACVSMAGAGRTVTTIASVGSFDGDAGINDLTGLVVHGGSIYFATDRMGGGSLLTASVDGGAAPKVLAQGGSWPIAVDGQRAYWAGIDIEAVDLAAASDADASTALVSAPTAYGVQSIAVDATNLYWTNGGAPGAVLSVSLQGGEVVTLASALTQPAGVAVDATSVYWLENAIPTQPGRIMKAPLAGGPATTLVSGPQGVTEYSSQNIVVDSTSVYWTNAGPPSGTPWVPTGAVVKVPSSGGTPVTLAANRLRPTGALAVDADSVYWTEWTQWIAEGGTVNVGNVMKAPINGGSPTTLACGLSYLGAIAVDDTSVYVVANDSDVVRITPK